MVDDLSALKGAAPLPQPVKKVWALPYKIASTIEPQETTFLWRPYIPFGAVTLIAGKGGIGKSTIVCDVVARLSTGRCLPGQDVPLPPMRVLMVSAEDDLSHKLVPKLIELGANMNNIAMSDETFVLDDPHVGGIERAMADFDATIVVLDPIVAYLGGAVDMNKSNETRDFMNKLTKIARGKDKAVVVVAHSRKNVGRSPTIDDVMGSADFSNAVRSGIIVYESEGVRHFKHDKANWSEKGVSWSFDFNNGLSWYPDDDPGVGRVNTKPRIVDKAKELLLNILTMGPELQREIVTQAHHVGISEGSLMRAKVGLVSSTKTKEGWLWHLTAQEDPNPELTYLTRMGRVAVPKEIVKAVRAVKPSPKPEPEDKIAALLAQARAKLAGVTK